MDAVELGIAVACVRARQVADAPSADLRQPIGLDREADDVRAVDLEELARRLDAAHERNVRRLVALEAEVHRERRLAGPRDADEHDVGLLEPLAVEAVVVLDDELHGGDAAEVVGVEADRAARREVGLVPGRGGERLERRAEQVAARHAVARAELLEGAPQVAVDERVEDHDARARGHAAVVRGEVVDRRHARMPHDRRAVAGELRLRGARDAGGGISRGVGDEVDLDRRGGRCHAPHGHRRSGRRQRRAVASFRRSTSNWRTPAIGTRTCSSESRSRTVTASSSSDSWSTVIAHGVPISSWRR